MKIEDQIYLLYCEVGNARHWIESCTEPKRYFSNYEKLMVLLRELAGLENQYPFHSPLPHEELQCVKKNFDEISQKFIYRAWEACLNRAATRKTPQGRLKVIQAFFSQMETYKEQFPAGSRQVLKALKDEKIDFENLEKRSAPPPTFDLAKERELKNAVENSKCYTDSYYALLALSNFYYKYRDLDTKYVDYCIRLYTAEIALLPKVSAEFDRLYKRSFSAVIPAFDKLYMIYYRNGEYNLALQICQQHLQCPQRGDDPKETAKIQKRIDLCQRKKLSQ